jgi:predicted small secreted protein
MKQVLIIAVLAVLTGCGTVGGVVSGAGSDLSRAGEWIRSR